MNNNTNPVVKPSAKILFPTGDSNLIEIRDHNVIAGIVNRDKAYDLGDWNSNRKQGVYVLLSDLTQGSFTIYVGYTSGDFQQRFTRDHLKTKDFWTRAIMFIPSTEHGITSTEALWLEGNLVKQFTGSPNIKLTNVKHTGDKSVGDTDLYALHMMTESIMRILSLFGYISHESTSNASPRGDRIVSERLKTIQATQGAWSGAWHESAQRVNDAAIVESDLVVNVGPVGVESVGTDAEVAVAQTHNVPVLHLPDGGVEDIKRLMEYLRGL